MASLNSSSQPSFFTKRLSYIIYFLLVVLLAVTVVWLNLSWRTDVNQLPADSGFYAYVGRAILHGQLLYRDLWDNKPPLVYYLNAFGQLVFGQTPWGVWWSSVLWMMGCVMLCFVVVKKIFGGITAALASFLFLSAIMDPQLFQGGNLTEVYALAPQLGIIAAAYLFFTHGRKSWPVLLAGVLTACAFLFKQPTIGLGIASITIIIASTINRSMWREALKLLFTFGLGFLGLLALVALYWLANGALGDLIDGAFSQGISSIGGAQSSFRYFFKQGLAVVLPQLHIGELYLVALLAAGVFLVAKLYQFWLKPVLQAGLAWFEWLILPVLVVFPLLARHYWPGPYSFIFWLLSLTLAGFLLWLKFYRLPSRPAINQVFSATEWIWLLAITALPLEAFLVSLGGRYYGHYYTTMIPSIILAAACPFWRVALLIRNGSSYFSRPLANSAYVLLAVGSLVWGGFSFIRDIPPSGYTKNITGIFNRQVQLNELQQYIVETTQPTDTVLVWHIHLGINFITGRNAPSRFLYPLNLFIPPSPTNTKLKQYIDELESHPPELIVVQKISSISLPFVNQPLDNLCHPNCAPDFAQAIEIPQIRQEWLRFQQFFEANYTPAAEIYDWIVFRKLP